MRFDRESRKSTGHLHKENAKRRNYLFFPSSSSAGECARRVGEHEVEEVKFVVE